MKKGLLEKIAASAWTGLVEFLLASPVNAANNIENASDIKALLCVTVFGYMFLILIALSAIMGLVGAYLYMTSGGDAEKVSKASKTLTYAAIGVVVALAARGIPKLIADLLGQADVGSC